MKFFSVKAVSIPVVAVAALLGSGLQDAFSANLFDLLFRPNPQYEGSRERPRVYRPREPRQREFRRHRQRAETPRKAAPRKAALAPKISAPSYYTYRADPLKLVDFTPLAAIGQSASLEEAAAPTPFRAAIAGLEGFELFAEAEAGEAIVSYYAEHPDFIWVSGDGLSERARAAIRVLGEAAGHGLLPADYSVEIPAAAGEDTSRQQALIRFEMEMSARVLRYASDALRGRIDPNRISGYHDFPKKPLDMKAALAAVASSPDTRAWLESHHPRGPEYRALRVELEALAASAENDIVIEPGLLLKPGQTSPELTKILQLIARSLDDEMGGEYGELLARLVESETYAEELIPVIKAAQGRHGLKEDGVIGPRTVAALAGVSKAERLDRVRVALEQLRWLPSELGSTRVFINQPAFTARFIENGHEKLHMRVVVGKPSNQTSFFYDEIEQVDYNPYWGVPQSILVNEMLPRLRRDPGYLDRAGYEVTDARGRRISSSSINWWRYGAKIPYNVRQTPSEANALGELKILFPNAHAIYMHDTPQKELFQRDSRAFSHGCVRLADPRGMAAAVLGTDVDYIAQKLKTGHSSEKVPNKIPVYVAYFTAWPDKHGKVEYFADVYDRDSRVAAAFEKTDEVRAPTS
jgi:murein L,D-transpeptidase YcbB/YkuD